MDEDRRDFLYDSARVSAFALASTALWPIAPAVGQSGSGRELATMTIVELSRLLASQKITSRQLVEQSLAAIKDPRSEEHTSELQSRLHLVCRLLLEKKKS